jgi:uncharacterized membrane protein YdbT with pleckstrin-like domain
VELQQGENVIWRGRPSWRSIMSYWIRWTTLSLVPLAVILVVDGTTDADWPIWLGVLITLGALFVTFFVGWFKRISTRYTVTTHRLLIREGIISREEHSAHIDRVQNVTVRQSLADRLFKVGAVDFDTAGGDDYEFTFLGVDRPGQLRDRISHSYGARVEELEGDAHRDPQGV